jgi:hypothetical protein
VSDCQVLNAFETPTGTSASEILEHCFVAVNQSTDQWRPSIVYVNCTKTNELSMFWDKCDISITDADALQRTVQGEFESMAQSLAHLSNAVKAIFPGMRGLTKAESESLRSYYKKKFRTA